mgnify:CR=1 FL=1
MNYTRVFMRRHKIYMQDNIFNLIWYRVLDGDKSDFINGIKGAGLKSIIKYIEPLTKEDKFDLDDLLEYCEKSDKKIKLLENIKNSSKLIKDMQDTDEEASLTWLQQQQKKLKERREIQRRRVSRDRDNDMMHELKTSLTSARPDEKPTIQRSGAYPSTSFVTNGYTSSNNPSMMSQCPVVKQPHSILTPMSNSTSSSYRYQYQQREHLSLIHI